jgi:serine/threonine protein kinase
MELPADTRFCPRDGTTVKEDTIALTTGAILAIGPAPPPIPTPAMPAPPTEPTPPPAADAPDVVIGRVIDGRYRVRALLGKGAVGAVYEAEQVGLGRSVALKVLNAAVAQTEEFRKRFEREARAASQLSHPGCVSVLDFGHVSRIEPPAGGESLVGMPYLVMELARGELLLDRIARGKMPHQEAVVIARAVLSALRHAHALQIVHRDVKPANIMLASASGTAPVVKLLDFGLAKSVAEDSPDKRQPLTQKGMIFGTPTYLSPEAAAGQPVDGRTDLYSLGIVLFEMVCGRPPFDSNDKVDVVHAHMVRKPPSPRELVPSLPQELEAAIGKALEKDPARRFQTAEEFHAALAAPPTDDFKPAVRTAPRQPAWRDDLRRLVRQRRKQLVIAAAVAVPLVALLVWRLARTPEPAAPPLAVDSAPQALQVSPSAYRHLQLAADYQRKLWCADAIDELDRALRDEPALRAAPDLVRIAVPCLRQKTQDKAAQFLVRVGADARPELEAALAGNLKPDVREGVQRVLARLSAP